MHLRPALMRISSLKQVLAKAAMNTNTFRTLCIAAFLLLNLTSAEAQRANRLAFKAFELGNFAEAAEAYEKIVKKSGVETEDYMRYAESLRMLGRLEEAVATYELIGAVDNPDIAYKQARALAEYGQYPRAVERLQVAARANHAGAAALAKRIEYAQAHLTEASAWKVSNEFINSPGDEYGITPFGNTIIFASSKADAESELLKSVRDNNNFLRVPTKLHKVGGEPSAEAPLAYSPSGDLVVYTRNNFVVGERMLPDAGWELSLLTSATAEQGDFLSGKPFPHNGSGYSTGFPAFSADGQRLYFASDRPGGEGGFDLYYVERQTQGWGEPVNLGPAVNSPGDEVAPYATASALYFSSDHLPGFGGMDIYRADLLDASPVNVVNLGPGVNSPLDDVGFVLTADEQIGYFASNRLGGKGGMDIYRATRSGTAVTFAVVDGKTNAPIANAVLDFSDCGQGVFLTGIDGSFAFRALPSLDCRPFVRKSGYNAKQFSLVGKTVNEQQRIEIVLNPEDKITIYEGLVVDSRTGDVIPGVHVHARQRGGDYAAEATSDSSGRYELPLERVREYVVDYQAPGYARIDRQLSTFDSDGANVLSTFALFPDGSRAAAFASAGQRPIDPDSLPSEAIGQPGAGKGSTSQATSPSTAGSAATGQGLGSVSKGFSVQVAAVAAGAKSISDYQSRFGEYGQVYGRVDGDIMRVRIGPYASRDEAMSLLAKIKAGPVKDAFLAAEDGGVVVGIAVPPAVETAASSATGVGRADSLKARAVQMQPTTPAAASTVKTGITWDTTAAAATTPGATESTPVSAPVAVAPPASAYMIRLATYSSLANFDQAKASALGTLTTRRSGDYVVVLLQGYESAAQAQARVAAVRQGGFPDAHVVEEQGDGTLRIVR